jgi:hypothetical protein
MGRLEAGPFARQLVAGGQHGFAEQFDPGAISVGWKAQSAALSIELGP